MWEVLAGWLCFSDCNTDVTKLEPPYPTSQTLPPSDLPVRLHDAAQVGRFVRHVLQVRLEKLAEHVEGAVHRELLERVQRPLVQLRVCELAGFVDVVQLAGDLCGTEIKDAGVNIRVK